MPPIQEARGGALPLAARRLPPEATARLERGVIAWDALESARLMKPEKTRRAGKAGKGKGLVLELSRFLSRACG